MDFPERSHVKAPGDSDSSLEPFFLSKQIRPISIISFRSIKEEKTVKAMKMNRSVVGLVSLLLAVFSVIGSMPSVWAGPAEESAQVGEQWIKAFLEGNAEILSGLYAKDASMYTFMTPFLVQGRDAIRGSFAGLFKAYPVRAITKRHFNVQIYDSTVVRTYYFTMTLGDSKGNIKNYHGRANIVYMMVDDQRMIVTHHSSLLPL